MLVQNVTNGLQYSTDAVDRADLQKSLDVVSETFTRYNTAVKAGAQKNL
jgi:hypothetical protein